MKYFKKLMGEQIYLSPHNIEDAERYADWMNNLETTEFTGMSSIVWSKKMEENFIEKSSDGSPSFTIVTRENDIAIGNCELKGVDYRSQTAEVGILIGDLDSRSKGIGTEVVNLLLDYGFNYLNLNNIMLKLISYNDRAYKCYTKCGFKEFGRRRDVCYVNGKRYDLIYMDILKSEFTGSYIKNKGKK